MVAVAVTSSRMADSGRGLAQDAPPAPAGHPAEWMLDADTSAGRLAPAVGLMAAVTVSLGLWGLLFAAARLVMA